MSVRVRSEGLGSELPQVHVNARATRKVPIYPQRFAMDPPQTEPQTEAQTDTCLEPYSLPYDELVQLIVQDLPVPGIKTVSTRVLGPQAASQSRAPPRTKPWEYVHNYRQTVVGAQV